LTTPSVISSGTVAVWVSTSVATAAWLTPDSTAETAMIS
jgi:hypothetical protein